ncbi:MAG TPA: glycoside hydrolase family 3 protein [Candidatus Bipolaricaulota bacterium]|nr:glycoside hydrolase family 3 protein [Candidatus Bipolaricaulota bacterium]
MKKILLFVILIVSAGALFAWFYFEKNAFVGFQEKDRIAETIDNMTLEEKVGQMFVVGFWGEAPDANVVSLIQEKNIGGVILLKYNADNKEQLSSLIDDLQSRSEYPLLISTDQEGGTVTKIKVAGVKEFTAQSSISDVEQAYKVAFDRGKELSALGFNVNFSPVLDFITDKNSFLWSRVFRGSIDDFGEFGRAMVGGYQAAGISACIKHFPGHSNGSIDSHGNLPTVEWSKEEFDENISQFKKALEADPGFVMVGHIKYPNIDPENPSSLSKIIVQDILRGQLNYQGVIITDDMEMGALQNNFSNQAIAIKAVLAGNDILLYVSSFDKQVEAYEAVLEAVKSGVISESRIDESVYRILELKMGSL